MAKRKRKKNKSQGGWGMGWLALGGLAIVGAVTMAASGGGTPITGITPQERQTIKETLTKLFSPVIDSATFSPNSDATVDYLLSIGRNAGFTSYKALMYLYPELILIGHIASYSDPTLVQKYNVQQLMDRMAAILMEESKKSGQSLQSRVVSDIKNYEQVLQNMVNAGSMDPVHVPAWRAAIQGLLSQFPM